ncbi:MAG: HAMP domain-containing protein [Acidobacteria bacterium]|nr:HAMP domain-containing protein [Acidobacteriota bacterium]
MNLRTKRIIVFVSLALVPLAFVCLLQYRAGAGAVESALRERAAERAARMARDVTRVLSIQEGRLLELARSEAVRRYALEHAPAAGAQTSNGPAPSPAASVEEAFRAYAAPNLNHIQALTFIDGNRQAVFRLNRSPDGKSFVAQTTDLVVGHARHEEGVWAERKPEVLRSPLSEESYGAALRVTAPVYAPAVVEGEAAPAGAVVAEVRLGEVISEAGEALDTSEGSARRPVVALDNAADNVVYHTNGAFTHQTASGTMPYFAEVAARMKAGGSGSGLYDTAERGTQLAAFQQVDGLSLSVAASEDYAAALAPVRSAALVGGGLAALAALAGFALLLLAATRETRGIGIVARRASAVAAGDLEQRIEISHSGETRELAENFNTMADRLREMIAREAESRQFQSFMRISAMVTHDLKNAIAGLSMLVSNMEKYFDREEFRADAIQSLREATEKLKRTAARLSEPALSLSGEYRLAGRPTDLVSVIRRVLATNAEPTRPLNEVVARLPETLVVTAEPERIENVVENLVINALEAMGAKGGRLTVEAGKVDDDLHNDYVFFSVADTGVGMSAEFIRTKLYRPFSTTKNKGIGLGLFTCKEVVESHGGRLEVESSPGAGTRFRVVLPSRLFQSGEGRRRPEKVTASIE